MLNVSWWFLVIKRRLLWHDSAFCKCHPVYDVINVNIYCPVYRHKSKTCWTLVAHGWPQVGFKATEGTEWYWRTCIRNTANYNSEWNKWTTFGGKLESPAPPSLVLLPCSVLNSSVDRSLGRILLSFPAFLVVLKTNRRARGPSPLPPYFVRVVIKVIQPYPALYSQGL